MTFINELIPEEEKAKIDFQQFTSIDVRNIDSEFLDTWTVNKEFNAYLIYLTGSAPNGPDYFGLYYNDNYFQFSAFSDIKISSDEKKINWKLQGMRVPVELLHKKNNDNLADLKKSIESLIQSALKAYGYLYKLDKDESVTVEGELAIIGPMRISPRK
ncbi:hypothetical protein H0A36_02630 [Endozoicomonas sp. SM1973]|uniref:Uncharacterized protein n=1 Tax=Spartinivicinus marinus TaxID=2994442 RepID=A0A853IBX1_9GAMM|nr:hypothetical protein [Spartinivicinus marinus]MCX4029871.1 hypothetical protein [Spartinivicinus marinus]NYZ64886.1 hypothetical protein [Spartinivicinus marinus]